MHNEERLNFSRQRGQDTSLSISTAPNWVTTILNPPHSTPKLPLGLLM